MKKMGFVLRYWFWSFEDNSEGMNSKYVGPWFLSRWLDVMIKVHKLIEFPACKKNIKVFTLYYQVVRNRGLIFEKWNLTFKLAF